MVLHPQALPCRPQEGERPDHEDQARPSHAWSKRWQTMTCLPPRAAISAAPASGHQNDARCCRRLRQIFGERFLTRGAS